MRQQRGARNRELVRRPTVQLDEGAHGPAAAHLPRNVRGVDHAHAVRFPARKDEGGACAPPSGFPGRVLLSRAIYRHSTIGAEGLNCRVRNGNGCFPLAMATGNSFTNARGLSADRRDRLPSRGG